MKKLEELIVQHQDKFKFALIAGIGIAAFNCFARADYNLIIYIYVYYIWNNLDSKVKFHHKKGNTRKRKDKIFLPDRVLFDNRLRLGLLLGCTESG